LTKDESSQQLEEAWRGNKTRNWPSKHDNVSQQRQTRHTFNRVG